MIYEIYALTSVGNIILLLALLYIFAKSYIEMRSSFTLGLVMFSAILLLDAFFTCPLVHPYLGGPAQCPVNGFYAVASSFEFLGLGVLLYIVNK